MLFNMALKTFNLNEEVYKKFSEFCKENGISMSKQVEIFIEAQMAEEPKVRDEYLQKLEVIRKGKFIKVDDFKKRYLK
jgi:antitoxin component of RelBE/YafQ-DinJ toxin-antitoxin module